LNRRDMPDGSEGAERRPWRRALVWLAVLGPFFFASYGLATWVSSRRAELGDIATVAFAWERAIPFVPWTIVPYWSIDLFYGLSLLLCATRRQLDTHVARLLATQILAVSCFLLFPLRCTFVRGEVDGVFGWLFATLNGFDQPFNQAPSLHIALLVVLLQLYLAVLPRQWHWPARAWALLIGVSVLTTWQHQFFDIPTGLWLGCFAVWLFPDTGDSPLRRAAWTGDTRRRRLAAAYLGGALVAGALALAVGGGGLWLLWPAGALLMVAAIHLFFDGAAFGKRTDGSTPLAARVLLAPYQWGARLNARWWTRRLAAAAEIAPGVWLGRLPTAAERRRWHGTVVDLCAELPCPAPGLEHVAIPMLDLVPPTPAQLDQATGAIDDALHSGRPVLVCCALGLARGALTAAAWLLRSGAATTGEEAVERVRRARPSVVLGLRDIALLDAWHRHARATDAVG